MKSTLIPALCLSLIFIATGCNKETAPEHYPLAESNGLDDTLLYEAVLEAEENGGILSLLVYRNQDLIAEEYFGKGGQDAIHPIKSVTKSVTSILTGFALEDGYIGSLDDKVSDYLSEELRPRDSLVAEVTLRQLLTMTGGFEWDELTDPTWEYWNNWIRSDDHFLYALQVPVIHEPGTHFTYCTTGCQIVSGIFQRATGKNLKEYAEEKLFTPLGIEGDRFWDSDQRGYNYGGVGLHLKARDMLQIGKLLLEEGLFEGQRLVPENWVSASTSAQVSCSGIMPYASDYGYYWWVGNHDGHSYYYANGYGGQFICVFPELALVVVAQSEIYNELRDPGPQWMSTLNLIMNEVLASVAG